MSVGCVFESRRGHFVFKLITLRLTEMHRILIPLHSASAINKTGLRLILHKPASKPGLPMIPRSLKSNHLAAKSIISKDESLILK